MFRIYNFNFFITIHFPLCFLYKMPCLCRCVPKVQWGTGYFELTTTGEQLQIFDNPDSSIWVVLAIAIGVGTIAEIASAIYLKYKKEEAE